jgi:hypothetical protein
VLLTGCTPPTMTANEDGPLVVLSAEAPTADFLVSLCYSGPRLELANGGYTAVARTSSPGFDTGPEVVLESSGPAVMGDEEGYDVYQAKLGTTLDVRLGDDDEVFVDTKSACTEKTMVHMGFEGELQPGQTIEFDWNVSALVRYERASGLSLSDPELEIRIEAV